MTAEGTEIYTVRNGLCAANPGAVVRIWNIDTNKELKIGRASCRERV